MAKFRMTEVTYWDFEADDEQQAQSIADNFGQGLSGLGMKHAGYEVDGPVRVWDDNE